MPSRRPPRIHLIHHLFDALPTDRWFSAWELAELLYRDCDGAHRQQKRYVEQVLNEYAYTPLVAVDDSSAACRLYRRVGPGEEPRPKGPNGDGALQTLHRHAIQPLTREDLETLVELREAAGGIGKADPKAAAYDRVGRPVRIGSPSWTAADRGNGKSVKRCPPALATAGHDPDRAEEPLLRAGTFFGTIDSTKESR